MFLMAWPAESDAALAIVEEIAISAESVIKGR
jgi:hypothetical protein